MYEIFGVRITDYEGYSRVTILFRRKGKEYPVPVQGKHKHFDAYDLKRHVMWLRRKENLVFKTLPKELRRVRSIKAVRAILSTQARRSKAA